MADRHLTKLAAHPSLLEFERDQVREIITEQQAHIRRLEERLAQLEGKRDDEEEIDRLAYLLEHLETAVGEAGVTLFTLYENNCARELATELRRAMLGRPTCRLLCPTCKRPRCYGCVPPRADVWTEDAIENALADFTKRLEAKK